MRSGDGLEWVESHGIISIHNGRNLRHHCREFSQCSDLSTPHREVTQWTFALYELWEATHLV